MKFRIRFIIPPGRIPDCKYPNAGFSTLSPPASLNIRIHGPEKIETSNTTGRNWLSATVGAKARFI
jgi:hypothetical protein